MLGAVVLIVAGLFLFRMWDGHTRVHSAAQAVAMAREAYGPTAETLPVRVEADQDFWIVRLGPDAGGKTHSYLVTIWDKQAREGLFQQQTTIDVDLKRP